MAARAPRIRHGLPSLLTRAPCSAMGPGTDAALEAFPLVTLLLEASRASRIVASLMALHAFTLHHGEKDAILLRMPEL